MLSAEKISPRQFTWLTVTICFATSSIIIPGLVAFSAKQNSWLALVIATIVILGGGMLNLALASQFPGQTVVQYAQVLLGPWLGKLVGLVYASAFLYLIGTCLHFITRLFKISIMPDTPLWPFVMGLILVAIFYAWLGLEPIARANEIVLPVIFGIILVVMLFAIPDGKLYQGLPVMQLNWPKLFEGAFPAAACMSEAFYILMLAPALNQPDKLKSSTVKGILLTGLSLAIMTQFVIFILGSFRTAAYIFPFLRITAEMIIWDVFESLEPLIICVWVMINIVKMGTFSYLFALSIAQTFNLKSYRKFLVIALIGAPIINLAPADLADMLQFWVGVICFKIVLPTVFLVIPGILLLIAKVRKMHA